MAERVFLTVPITPDIRRALRRLAAEKDLSMATLARSMITREILADVIPIDGLRPGEAERRYDEREAI